MCIMDVHEPHANMPLHLTPGAERMSVVCYLRTKVWQDTRGMDADAANAHLDRVRAFTDLGR